MTGTGATAGALVARIRALADEIHPRTYPVAVRVRLRGTGPELASCEIWTGDADALWVRRADLSAAVGRTLLDLERALAAAGFAYGRTEDGRARYRYDEGTYTLDLARPGR
ncbi:hypothetical protein [Isoptericola sp. BMS4]|uniref:hypothetical protein n=1 Tax=Isoptericola sp. BMS4 TaxID=2527875 RepID=UPI0014228FDE|nr:hypothetical protein [Isoptericola sp. BMS4]